MFQHFGAFREHGARLIGVLAARGLEAVSKFGLYAVAARVLGGDSAGEFFLCLSLIHVITTVARLGMDRPITRHVAAEWAIGRPDLAAHKAMGGAGLILASSIALSFGLVLAAQPVAQYIFHDPTMGRALMLSALVVPIQNIAYTVAFVLIGLDRGVLGQLVMNAVPPTLTLTAVLVGARTAPLVLASYAAAFSLCAAAGAAAIGLAWRDRLRGEGGSGLIQAEALPSMWGSAKALFVVELVQAALLTAPVLALGAFASQAAVSDFSIASRATMLISTIVLSIASLAAPAFARAHRRADFAGLRKLNRDVFLASVSFGVPLMVLIAMFAPQLATMLGSPTAAAASAMLILLIGQAAYCLAPCRDTLLAMTGHGDALRVISLVQLVVALALCGFLVPPLGVIGAAIASSAIWALGAVLCHRAAVRLLPEAFAPFSFTALRERYRSPPAVERSE